MKRLTFGVKPSPFLATKVLHHLAESNKDTHPLASHSILTSFYVDDFLSGASTLQEADEIRQELCRLLKSAGMILRKWRSNDLSFLETIPEDLRELADLHLPSPLSASKTLGIHWDVSKDNFHVSVPFVNDDLPVTKREIASISAKVFDIMGFYSPATVPSKILLQELWKLKLSWDDPVPDKISKKWKQWISTLSALSSHPIPRRLVPSDVPISNQSLHGFFDASTSAYGAVVYLRTTHEDGTVSITLVTSKSRVAPLKPVTIPRLELVAAHLLSKLLRSVSHDLSIPLSQIYAWSDSRIVLCWLHKNPATLKTFVSHRVASIQQIIPADHWRHVPTQDNPADLASRGVDSCNLISSSLWWKGPPWLLLPQSSWPQIPATSSEEVPDIRATIVATVQIIEPDPDFALWRTRYSSFDKLTGVVSWIRRFLHNVRNKSHILSSVLTSEELQAAKRCLLRVAQRMTHAEVFESIRCGRSLPVHHYSQSLTFHWVLISSSESVVEFEILTFPSLRAL